MLLHDYVTNSLVLEVFIELHTTVSQVDSF